MKSYTSPAGAGTFPGSPASEGRMFPVQEVLPNGTDSFLALPEEALFPRPPQSRAETGMTFCNTGCYPTAVLQDSKEMVEDEQSLLAMHRIFQDKICTSGQSSKSQGSAVGDPRRNLRSKYSIGTPRTSCRDVSLEAFDETEESDIQGSDSEVERTADPPAVDLLQSSPPAGRAPCLLASRRRKRASIVITDSRKEVLDQPGNPIRIAVFGKDGVGKSAIIVRLLTGRFIGEYDPSMEAVYSYKIPFDDCSLPLQVMDTAGTVDKAEVGREKQVAWGEGFMLVFSLTSCESLTALHHIRRVILDLTPGSPRPMVLVGNKADISHARQVSNEEILEVAKTWDCEYYEVAASETWDVVVRPFLALYRYVLDSRNGFNETDRKT